MMFKKVRDEPSVENGWSFCDAEHVKETNNYDGNNADYTRILWSKNGNVAVTTVSGHWEFDVLAQALGADR